MSDVCRCDHPVPDSKSGGGLHESKGRLCRIGAESLDVQAFNHQAEVKTKVLEEECSLMMKQFFRELRAKQKMKKKSLLSE